MADEHDGQGSAGFPVGGPLATRIRALGPDAGSADVASRRVVTMMGAMMTRFGLDPEQVRDAAPLEVLAAETCCASCREIERCHRYLEGTADEPEAFCPNAGSFDELAGGA